MNIWLYDFMCTSFEMSLQVHRIFPLLFEAAVCPYVWSGSLVQVWSGMSLLFDWWSHDNQPRWASLDKPILCLHIPCVPSHAGVSSSWMLLPCSPPKVQSAPQWWHTWLCQTKSQYLVVPGFAQCDVGSEELLLGQQSSSSPLWLWGTFALVVCWLVEAGPLLLGGNLCMGLGFGWAARWPPSTGFQLTQPVWQALRYGAEDVFSAVIGYCM